MNNEQKRNLCLALMRADSALLIIVAHLGQDGFGFIHPTPTPFTHAARGGPVDALTEHFHKVIHSLLAAC